MSGRKIPENETILQNELLLKYNKDSLKTLYFSENFSYTICKTKGHIVYDGYRPTGGTVTVNAK